MSPLSRYCSSAIPRWVIPLHQGGIPNHFLASHSFTIRMGVCMIAKRWAMYGSANSKLSKRREEHVERTHPHMATLQPKQGSVKRGRRAGWMTNPLLGVEKLSSPNKAYESAFADASGNLDKAFIQELMKGSTLRSKDSHFRETVDLVAADSGVEPAPLENPTKHNKTAPYPDSTLRGSTRERRLYASCDSSLTVNHTIADGRSLQSDQAEKHSSKHPKFSVSKDVSSKLNTSSHLFDKMETYMQSKNAIAAAMPDPQEFVDTHVKNLVQSLDIYNFAENGKNDSIYTDHEENVLLQGDSPVGRLLLEGEFAAGQSASPSMPLLEHHTRRIYSQEVSMEEREKPLGRRTARKLALDLQSSVKISKGPSHRTFNKDWESNSKEEKRSAKRLSEPVYEGGAHAEKISEEFYENFQEQREIRENADFFSLWKAYNAHFMVYHECLIPSHFPHGTIASYKHTRMSASLFDLSYKTEYLLGGEDRIFVGDHFLSCSLRKIAVGDVQYALILDSKGLILDDCFVLKKKERITLLTSSFQRRSVLSYLISYIHFCRKSGLDVSLNESSRTAILAIQGPKAVEALVRTLKKNYKQENLSGHKSAEELDIFGVQNERKDNSARIQPLRNTSEQNAFASTVKKIGTESTQIAKGHETYSTIESTDGNAASISILVKDSNGECVSLDTLLDTRYMSSFIVDFHLTSEGGNTPPAHFEVDCLRVGFTGEDGVEMIMHSDVAPVICRDLLRDYDVLPAGLFAFDILRMEAGLPQSGVDFNSHMTPVKASLVWLLDQQKMRNHLMFGWKQIFNQIGKAPRQRRVGIVSDKFMYGGCQILSNPNRRPIGMISSSTWSPQLKCRIAQGFLKPEFAKNNEVIFVAIPQPISKRINKHRRKKLIRMGGIRKLIVAKVVRFPFVSHNYPMISTDKRIANGISFKHSSRKTPNRFTTYDANYST
ncbi:glycine cleavage T-protein (aminomethyl transferase) domain-containing protein [Cardiosporidium cionae]|uniref:Glycine cleavage T-protein (Aminomethyl transferase) domain-containing protein n=1 Tax=Cardiosporidium cionae TaxID=476202 RepID=A0ABQ7J8F8_9APIC|nr:glycine cleavage T-protein (aminomethyl transferase) domain-containing protein [Cardiosporidium cionae]|eukprot:KAF8819940.1 glycine cleavage T-protein (aminomethyl transferase) domain-containing protein [Cardiosporidium cionae]